MDHDQLFSILSIAAIYLAAAIDMWRASKRKPRRVAVLVILPEVFYSRAATAQFVENLNQEGDLDWQFIPYPLAFYDIDPEDQDGFQERRKWLEMNDCQLTALLQLDLIQAPVLTIRGEKPRELPYRTQMLTQVGQYGHQRPAVCEGWNLQEENYNTRYAQNLLDLLCCMRKRRCI